MDDQRGFHEQPQPKYHAGYGSRGRSPACLMRSKMEFELGIADLEGVVVTVERGIVVEQERQAVVHPNRREMAASRIERQADDVGEEPGGGYSGQAKLSS